VQDSALVKVGDSRCGIPLGSLPRESYKVSEVGRGRRVAARKATAGRLRQGKLLVQWLTMGAGAGGAQGCSGIGTG